MSPSHLATKPLTSDLPQGFTLAKRTDVAVNDIGGAIE